MRINKYVALCSHLSRRKADEVIAMGLVTINGQKADTGDQVNPGDSVTLAGNEISPPEQQTIILNKPVGYVVSRNGQGSKTIYELLPEDLQGLNPVGRLDKDSSGLLLLTNDGELSQSLMHPSKQKQKLYEVELTKNLTDNDRMHIEDGVQLADGISHMQLEGRGKIWQVTISEGRNRQIRRTFSKLGYIVEKLHRTVINDINLGDIEPGKWQQLKD